MTTRYLLVQVEVSGEDEIPSVADWSDYKQTSRLIERQPMVKEVFELTDRGLVVEGRPVTASQ